MDPNENTHNGTQNMANVVAIPVPVSGTGSTIVLPLAGADSSDPVSAIHTTGGGSLYAPHLILIKVMFLIRNAVASA